MTEKKIFTVISCGVMALACFLYFILEKTEIRQTPEQIKQTQNANKNTQTPKTIEPKHDLYIETPYDLPFTAIENISKFSPKLKKYIDEILETAQGFYFLISNESGTNVKILLQNPITDESVYNRHNLQFIEIIVDGNGNYEKKIFSPTYTGEENEIINAIDEISSKNDVWTFDKSQEPYLPLKHKKYGEKGKAIFTEKWDYSPNAQIKYQMKNSKNKTISVLKETIENDTNYRQEHIIYNENGNIHISIRINFDGANITRFSYYNSERPSESINIFSEYSDGLKTKEILYDSNYQLIKTLTCDYEGGTRKALHVFDKDGKKINILKN